MIQNLTMSDYLANPAYGASDVIKMRKSFAYFEYKRKNPDKPGRPLVIGNATHTLTHSLVSRDPSIAESIKVYKEGSSKTDRFKSFQAANPGFYCLDNDEWEMVQRMVAALIGNQEVMSYLADAIPESTILSKFPGTNVNVKCRPDYLHLKRGVSINIKTCVEATESAFVYQARDFGYDWQSAFYCDILSQEYKKPFDEVHILVEKVEDGGPIPIKIFSFGDDTISWARTQMRKVIEAIPECERTGVWPKQRTMLETVDLPLYARHLVSL